MDNNRRWVERWAADRRVRGIVAGGAAVVLLAGGGATIALSATRVAETKAIAPALTTTTSDPRPIPPPTSTSTASTTTATTPARRRSAVAPVALVAYGNCSNLLSDVKAEALKEVGPYGLTPQPDEVPAGGPAFAPVAGAAASSPAASPSGTGDTASGGEAAPSVPQASDGTTSTPAYSGTNDQEAGVDEPDITKTDGRLLLVVRHAPVGLEVADVSTSTPVLDGFIALPEVGDAPQLFLTDGYAVVIGQGEWEPSGAPDMGGTLDTEVEVVSLADPKHPSVVRSFDLQGTEQGARLISGRILVVLQGQPDLSFVSPSGPSPAQMATATSRNQALVEHSSLTAWLPSVTSSPSGTTRTAECAAALHPTVPSGLGTVSVVSLDPGSDQPGNEVTVVGNASTVYASTEALYVATSPWAEQVEMTPGPEVPASGGITTDIHAFDLSDPATPRYLGSGVVAGTLIGQYAMSEWDGDLRVATTVGQATPAPGEGSTPTQLSDNLVTILAPEDGVLVPVGSIDGLGQGEKIYGVRFVGPLGYVVTFRQIDPLYVVDLSNPSHPTLDGQLGLTGYSSFLQPLGGSLLLGVGEAVDSNLRPLGLQLSVFDVSDPNAPVLRSRLEMSGTNSSAENDPHALLWWPSRRLVAMPVTSYPGYATPPGPAIPANSGSGGASGFNGLVVWHVALDGALQQVAQISQPTQTPSGGCDNCVSPGPVMAYPYGNGVERASVVGNLMYTVSDGGIMATDMDTWAQADWLPYAGG